MESFQYPWYMITSILGEEYRRRKELLNTCPLQQARWCVVSKQEMEKCENMIMAFAAKGMRTGNFLLWKLILINFFP